jgi:hypothetical protein
MTDLIATPATLGGPTTDEGRAAEVLEIVDQLKSDFADRDTLYKDIEAVIHNEIEPKIPNAYQKTATKVYSPLAGHIVNTVTAALTVNRPVTQFKPTGFGTSYEENATLREHFFDGSFRTQEEEAKRRLFRLFMYSMVTKGEGILKTWERTKSAWGQYDAYSRKLAEELDTRPEYKDLDWDAKSRVYDKATEDYKLSLPYPITTTDVLPETFYYLNGENGFTVAGEIKDVPYLETLARYGHGLNSRGEVVPQAMALPRAQWGQVMGKLRTIRMHELWLPGEVRYVLAGPNQTKGAKSRGTLVKRVRHDYTDPVTKCLKGPYFHALGITTASRLPHRAGLSVLYGFLPLFPLLNSLLTIEAQVAYMYGWPSFKRKANSAAKSVPDVYGKDGSERDAEVELAPGSVYPDDIEPVEMPRGSESIDKMIGLVRGMLELALPSVVQGIVGGDESGYALNQAAYLARLAWDPIVDNAEFALAERVGFESWMIEHCIGEPVHAWYEQAGKKQRKTKAGYLSIGPDDLKGVHRYTVRLDPETPSNKVIEQRYHSQMMADRLETWEDAVTAMGHNPDEVEKSWMLKDMKSSPEIQELVKQRTLQKVALKQQKALAGAGLGPNGMPEAGAQLGNVGQVFQPGQNGQPMTPTPQGSVTGMGPQGRAMAAGGIGGGPVSPNQPANHIALPGEM